MSFTFLSRLRRFINGNNVNPSKIVNCYHECRNLCTGVSLREIPLRNKAGKLFLESENNSAHSILEKLPNYSITLLKSSDFKNLENSSEWDSKNWKNGRSDILLSIEWNTVDLHELCTLFKTVSIDAMNSHLPMSDGRYSSMITLVIRRLHLLSDQQLIEMINCLKLWPMSDSPKASNFYEFWKELDNICVERSKSWDQNKVLFFIDLWYWVHLIRQSDFCYKSIVLLGKKPNRLSPPQLVQFLFYLNAMRTAHKGVTMYNVEYRLEEIMDKLSTEELGVALLGFFKTQTMIHSEALISKLMRRFIDEIEHVSEVPLCSFLKVIRMSIPIALWPDLPELLDSVETQLERLSLKCAIHAALACTRSKTVHPGVLNKASKKLLENLREARLKDMEKIIYALTLLNCKPKVGRDVFNAVAEELENPDRVLEFGLHPRSLVALVHFLTLQSVFSISAIKKVLDMSFIRETYGRKDYVIGREILMIDTCVDLECPDYDGPRLPEDVRNYLSKRYSVYRPKELTKLSKHDHFLVDVTNTAEDLLGKDFVSTKYLLPNHPRPDPVFCLDDFCKPLPLSEDFKNVKDFTGPIMAPPGNWYCLVVGSKNMFTFNSSHPTGETACKLKQLKIIGYKPIVISWDDWPGSGTANEKLKVLRDKIFSVRA